MSCAFASDLGLAKVLQNKKTYASDLKLSHKGGSSWAHVTFYGSLQRLIRTHGATGTSRKVDGTLFAFLDILAGTAGPYLRAMMRILAGTIGAYLRAIMI